MQAAAQRSIRIAVDRDGLSAHLIATDVDPGLVNRDNIVSSLKELGIPVSDTVLACIEQVEDAARRGELPDAPVLLARGQAPVEGTGASFQLAPELLGEAEPAADSPEQRTDYYRSQIVTVSAEQVIGTWTPPVLPTPGLDVFGKPVVLPPPLQSVQPGKNVRLAEDGSSLLASVAGKLHLTRYQISVLPVVEISGDVDFSTGNIESTTDVLVNGTVRDTFHVQSAGSITVRGAIEASEVSAGTELQVNGGIASRGQGQVRAGAEVFTKFCNEARVEAGGDITITREAMNSILRTQGRLLVPRGKLLGGRAYAREGGLVAQLGNEANLKTTIALGVDPLALAQIAQAEQEIQKKLEAVSKIRQSVQPLMAQLKRLTPAQREKATELLYQADAMEQEIRQQEQQRKAALELAAPGGREIALTVQRIAYPGVSIVFGDRVTSLHKERKGPFKLVRRIHNRVEEILLVDKISGSITVLPSREYDAQDAANDFGTMAGGQALDGTGSPADIVQVSA